MKRIRLVTRKSPLAMKQTGITRDRLKEQWPTIEVEIIPLITTGDKQQSWSLEKRGGKGLFTKELEEALLRGDADIAVHSAKDLPTEMPQGLDIAGFLARDVAHDVLIYRKGIDKLKAIATGSPRRRHQYQAQASEKINWTEIRGNVGTRLRKIQTGEAEATFMAAAGLKRLGIESHDGLEFKHLSIDEMVPAAGQAAIALQCRSEDSEKILPVLDRRTQDAVTIERCFLEEMGAGCHSAFAAHFENETLRLYHDNCGFFKTRFPLDSTENLTQRVQKILTSLKLKP